MRLRDCHNFHDFRALARRRLPGPIFDYIDGAADDEATLRQNAASFERCDLVPNGMLQFALKPMWAINYLTHERFKLPQLDEHVDMGGGAMSIGRYFTEMLDPSMNWNDVGQMVRVGCKACGRNRLHRHHLIQPRWATARWLAYGI